MWKGFGAVYPLKEEETAPNGLPLDLSIFNKAGHLCIRHKGINGCMIMETKQNEYFYEKRGLWSKIA